jgi:selenocysteine lyase/cysteine desulfurase
MDYRAEFFEFDDVAYMDVAHQGPLPRAAVRALQKAIELKKLPHLFPHEAYFALPDRVRALLARMVGGKAEEIALTTGASAGLAAVGMGLDWQPDDAVLVAQGEFPAHFATFAPLAEAGRLRLEVVAPRGRFLTADDFLERMGPRTKLVSASLVRFDNGALLDAARLADACRSFGALLLLDASQCTGAMPLDVRALGADFLVSSGYKWLLSPYGTGFFWIREELIDRMRPLPFYWMALEGASRFDSLAAGPYRPARGAHRWDAPETASLQLAAMEASLELLLRLGIDTVREHNEALVRQLLERLPRDRCIPASPGEAAARGPFVCVAARSEEKTRVLHEKLRAAKIFVSLRENALRVAPHLFNTPGDIDRLLAVLAL